MPGIKDLMVKHSRELFLTGITLGFGAIATVVLGIPLLGYALSPLINPEKLVYEDVARRFQTSRLAPR